MARVHSSAARGIFKRRTLLISALIMSAAVPMQTAAANTDFPNKPIRLVVAYATGSSMDLMARLLSQPLQEELGQPVVVENRGGAGGIIGTDYVANAAPDGYTMVIGTPSNMVMAPLANDAAKYDLDSFKGVGRIASYYFLIGTANKPDAPKTLKELTAELKTGNGSFAATGVGTVVHLTGIRYMRTAGVTATEVHYQGSGQVLTDVAAGHALFSTETIAASLPVVTGGMLRPLAVTSPERFRSLPDVPTVAESGHPGFQVQSWAGLWVPAKTPQPTIERLNQALSTVLASEKIKERLIAMGLDPVDPLKPESFDAFVASEAPGWIDAFKQANIKQ